MGTDTVSQITTFIVDEVDGKTDTFTFDVVTDRAVISDLDDKAVGTFMLAVTGDTINFEAGAGNSLSSLLAGK